MGIIGTKAAYKEAAEQTEKYVTELKEGKGAELALYPLAKEVYIKVKATKPSFYPTFYNWVQKICVMKGYLTNKTDKEVQNIIYGILVDDQIVYIGKTPQYISSVRYDILKYIEEPNKMPKYMAQLVPLYLGMHKIQDKNRIKVIQLFHSDNELELQLAEKELLKILCPIGNEKGVTSEYVFSFEFDPKQKIAAQAYLEIFADTLAIAGKENVSLLKELIIKLIDYYHKEVGRVKEFREFDVQGPLQFDQAKKRDMRDLIVEYLSNTISEKDAERVLANIRANK